MKAMIRMSANTAAGRWVWLLLIAGLLVGMSHADFSLSVIETSNIRGLFMPMKNVTIPVPCEQVDNFVDLNQTLCIGGLARLKTFLDSARQSPSILIDG